MANRKESKTYIQKQLYKNRVANTLKKDNDNLKSQNTLLKNELRKLGYNI